VHIQNEHWQETVTGLAGASSAITMSYASGASLDWEAELALGGRKHPVVLFLPFLGPNWRAANIGDELSDLNRANLPGWLRSCLEAAPAFDAQAWKKSSVVIGVQPDGKVHAVRSVRTWASAKRSLKRTIRATGIHAVPNPCHDPSRTRGLFALQTALRWAPLMSVLITAGAVVAASVFAFGAFLRLSPDLAFAILLPELIVTAALLAFMLLGGRWRRDQTRSRHGTCRVWQFRSFAGSEHNCQGACRIFLGSFRTYCPPPPLARASTEENAPARRR
jgi:hypothetical protein